MLLENVARANDNVFWRYAYCSTRWSVLICTRRNCLMILVFSFRDVQENEGNQFPWGLRQTINLYFSVNVFTESDCNVACNLVFTLRLQVPQILLKLTRLVSLSRREVPILKVAWSFNDLRELLACVTVASLRKGGGGGGEVNQIPLYLTDENKRIQIGLLIVTDGPSMPRNAGHP